MGTSDRLKPVADDDDGGPAGGLTFESAKTKMVVEALSDINILSHCDAFLGSISNFLTFIMSLLHARDPLRERGRIGGFMNTSVATFGGHAAAEELTSKFASGLDDAHAEDLGSKEAIVSCVGDRSLRDYWMVLYGDNIPSETGACCPCDESRNYPSNTNTTCNY